MVQQTLEHKVQRIYRIASVVATVEACFLFILGLDLTSTQTLMFILFGCPAPVVTYGLDRWLIGRHVRPIQAALKVGSLSAWIIRLVAINIAVSVAIIALLSTRVHRSMHALLAQMRRVQDGNLFVSQAVAEAVLDERIPLNGDRCEVSILFQDIRGFTSMAEQMDPAALVELLNQFFTEMVAAVEAEGGVVKQFLGDGVMALFGAPVAYTNHAERAVRAALGMRMVGVRAAVTPERRGARPR